MNEKKQTKKEITNADLARMMAEGFEKSDEKTDKKIDDLAIMIANGFNEVHEKMDKGFKEVKSDIKEIKEETENIKAEINKKVDKFTHNDLKYRVEKLEEKFA